MKVTLYLLLLINNIIVDCSYHDLGFRVGHVLYRVVSKGNDTLRNFVAWNRTAFYSRNNIASNLHDTLCDFVAGNSCVQQSCLVYHGLKAIMDRKHLQVTML